MKSIIEESHALWRLLWYVNYTEATEDTFFSIVAPDAVDDMIVQSGFMTISCDWDKSYGYVIFEFKITETGKLAAALFEL